MLADSKTHPTFRVAMILAALVAAFALASLFPSISVALILALLLAFMLRPFVRFFEIHVGIRRSYSVAIVLVLLTIFLILNAAQGIPDILNHVRGLYAGFRNFPLDTKIDELTRDIAHKLPFINPQAASVKIRGLIDETVNSVGQSAAAAAGSAFSFLIIPFVTYFALAEGDLAAKRLLERIPNKYFEMTLNVVSKIRKELVGYLRGWLLDSFVVGILNIIGFYMLGVQYAVLLGIVAGVANLIPYVGPFVGIVPAFFIAIAQAGDLSLLPPILIMTFVVQLFDNILIQPLCFAQTVDMHPLTVIVVLIVGNQLMGVLGMLLAIPLYTILKVTAVETHWGLKQYRITM
ncbi:MAG TPA: AI-2E family transporter [Bacteroidota bacterium]|nr:AI-2E family transporter [Bacteroidota bacterium]